MNDDEVNFLAGLLHDLKWELAGFRNEIRVELSALRTQIEAIPITAQLSETIARAAKLHNAGVKTFGQLIFTKRVLEKKMSQIEVAKALGVSNVTISRWEGDTLFPAPDRFRAIAEFYGVDEDRIKGFFWSKINPTEDADE
jgi:DNA-binding XRE family transcriptional regulator